MKKYFYVLIAVLVFAVIACYIVTLKSGDTVVSNTKTKTAITRIVDRKESGKLKKSLSKTKFSGTAVLIKNNKIVDSYVSGSATDVDKNMLTTTYEIDSLQKVLTAGLVMNQVNKGKLKLTDRVNKFIPDLPGSKYITIRELLDMNSGLSMKKMKFSGNNLSSAELLDVVIDNVRFDANTKKSGKWSYQPVNFVILSEILEEITGKSYKHLFDETYIKKLKLKQTEFAYDNNIKTNRAYGYVVKGNGDRIKQNPNGATVYSELGTGQIYMSITDYYKVISFLLNGKILGKNSAAKLYLPGKTKYRAGLYTSRKPFYRLANGYGYGFEDHVRISQDGKKAIVVFSNEQRKGRNNLKKKIDQLSKDYLNR